MHINEPLPLIERPRLFEDPLDDGEDKRPQTIFNSPHMEFYGYAIIAYTWMLFMVTCNTLFETWRYLLAPMARSTLPGIREKYLLLEKIFTTLDRYVLSLWCVYVVAWWWSFISWWGIKLFRHSKGSQED
ncbi:uncharacterized protein CANTADRAFT_44240 [Suhomyces tanzawaensis NRRL Y-17324]|uniref:Uncharacterized protein n=1 Tax=Suhomyces tanzawaensis NRRL Y-17324 TaxID=984487 RepID=A0A1E4SS36_9ASCO|nr:uncharacterized protein CANTADRAFT_44240 [Suhomyces tanzawaensis NRRL Y-17324]ODV82227.1 hypothetical protein CANTADRAFT_44240 [Suhomyces tanzawaensis NRRL Y-17324]